MDRFGVIKQAKNTEKVFIDLDDGPMVMKQ
jgi:hypothetical protein